MFWKWKRKTDRAGSDAPLFEVKRERRSTYRVDPDAERPVLLEVRAERVVVDNISAGGLAMLDQSLGAHSTAPARLILPDGQGPADVTIEVVRTSDDKRHHCRFVSISPELEDRIHHYVLEREKEIIRKGKIR